MCMCPCARVCVCVYVCGGGVPEGSPQLLPIVFIAFITIQSHVLADLFIVLIHNQTEKFME